MSDVTVLHNPKCSTSRAAVETIESAGVEAEVHQYLKAPLDEAALRELIGSSRTSRPTSCAATPSSRTRA